MDGKRKKNFTYYPKERKNIYVISDFTKENLVKKKKKGGAEKSKKLWAWKVAGIGHWNGRTSWKNLKNRLIGYLGILAVINIQ